MIGNAYRLERFAAIMKKAQVALAVALFVASVAIGIYAAEFTLKQTVLAGIAILAWVFGRILWKDVFPTVPFRRIQFLFDLSSLGRAFLESGLYTQEELPMDQIFESMPGRGKILLTWLEPHLFYFNHQNFFSQSLETSMNLKTPRHGDDSFTKLPDRLELRSTAKGYELVLIPSEASNVWPPPYQHSGVVLFTLPYALFASLQGAEELWVRHKKARKSLEELPDLKYHEIAEVRNGWFYESKYGIFRWWPV